MQHRILRRASLAAAFSLASIAANGQAADSDDSIEPIDNVTIIGRTSDVADVPGSAHVVDTEELEIFNHTDIMRVLRTVPGVYLQEEEGYGLRPNIGIRGSGLDRSARIALLEDGVLISPAPYAAPSAYYFPTQQRMSGLEVLKGPASVAVGPRTTGGALNMLSTPVPTEQTANVDLRAGEHGAFDLHAFGGNSGEHVSWLIETVQSASDGFKQIEGPVGGDTGYDIEDYVAKLQIDSDPTAGVYHSFRLKLGYTDQTSDQTYLGLTDADFALDPETQYAAAAGDVFNSEHEQVQASYVVDAGDNWLVKITAYRNDFERNWYKLQSVNGASLGTVLANPDDYELELAWLKGATSPDDAIFKRANNRSYYSQGVQTRVDWNLDFGAADVVLSAGLRIHKDEEDRFQHENGYRMQDGELVQTTAGPGGSTTNRVSDASASSYFVKAEFRIGDWILTPGVRFEDVTLRRFDFATDDPTRAAGPTRVRKNSVSTAIPGMGALYKVNDNWRVLAGIHKGFNPPGPGSSADEETSLNIEVGTRYDSGSARFEAIYFVNDYDNLVGTVTESTGGGGEIGDQFDAGEVVVSGIEMSAGTTLQAGNLEVPLGLRYTWTNEFEFRNAFESGFDPWGTVEVGDELPYIPKHQLRATAGLEGDRWRANLAAGYVGKMRTRAGQGAYLMPESTDSHLVWDVLASWKINENFSTYVKVDNLLDETYIAARRPAGLRPGLPRTAFVGVTYRL